MVRTAGADPVREDGQTRRPEYTVLNGAFIFKNSHSNTLPIAYCDES
jgi:hypothetical protein